MLFAQVFLERLTFAGSMLVNFVETFWPILIPAALGFVAVHLLLPGPLRYSPVLGGLLAALALLLGGWMLIRADTNLAETSLFYTFSGIAILAGGLLVTQRNPIRAALSFALVVLATCGLFLLQAAPFLMAATIIVYAGAIIVTFLFVIMLAQQAGVSNADDRSREPFLSSLAGFVLLGGLLCVLHKNYDTSTLDRLDDYFDKAGKAAQAKTPAQIDAALGDNVAFFNNFEKRMDEVSAQSPPAKKAMEGMDLKERLQDTQKNVVSAGVKLEQKTALLWDISRIGAQIRYSFGSLQSSGANLPLSGFSGLRPNLPIGEIPTDDRGKPAPTMPAANVAGLGKSLFTDYLLAVELAGTLLLVATIGAIAIAGRRPEELR